MKKEVGYIILCQCYSFVWEIAFEAYTDKKRRMIEGSGASHYDSMKMFFFHNEGKDDSINNMNPKVRANFTSSLGSQN